MRRSAAIASALLLPLLASPASRRDGAERACGAIVVTRASVSYPHASSLQAALSQARPCDWILLAPGVYRGPVVVRTSDLHIRGLDRSGVVLDGGHAVGNGITVTADDVWIENLTVRNFDRRTLNDDRTGTQIRWSRVHGWWGRYLTTYDDGLRGGYGLWAAGSRNGGLDHVYASGFDDSGLYVGACRDCHAIVRDAVAERNLIGLAATNASGHFVVEHSLFRLNAVGVSFNSSESDPPPPQLGTCDASANRSATPVLTTTRLARCTMFRDNRVLENDALDVPSNTAAVRPGAGIGIDLLGSYGDLIVGNRLAGNREIAILGLPLPAQGRTRFALAGNRIAGNRITGSRVAIALAGGAGSVDDCVLGNVGGPSIPPDLGPLSCTHTRTPPSPAAASRRVLALVKRLHAVFAAHAHVAQPAPPPQPTMPAPCRGAPQNPLCGKR